MPLQDFFRLANLFGGDNAGGSDTTSQIVKAALPVLTGGRVGFDQSQAVPMDDPSTGGIGGNLGGNRNIWGNILGAALPAVLGGGGSNSATDQSGSQSTANPFHSGMSPDEFRQAHAAYSKSKGITPNESSYQTWQRYYNEWGSKDPNYMFMKMNDAPEFGGTGSTYAHGGTVTPNNAQLGQLGSDRGIQANPFGGQNTDQFANQVYNTPAFDAYRQNVMNFPDTGPPSKLRIIGTGLASALQGANDNTPIETYARDQYGVTRRVLHHPNFWESLGNHPFDINQAKQILDMPQAQAEADWRARNEALKGAAQMETQAPGRMASAQLHQAQAAEIPQKEARTANENFIKLGQGQQRIDINQAKVELARWKAENPQGQIFAPKGGNVTLINRLTGEATDTGIPTGTLSEADRIALTGEQKLTQIGAEGTQKRLTAGMTGQQAMDRIAARGAQARETKQTVPGKAPGSTSANKPMSPSQQKVAQQLRANQALQEHPEWAGYIHQDPNTGMIQVDPPSEPGWFAKGLDVNTRNSIINYLNSAPGTSTTNAPSGTVIVQDKKGQKYSLPAEQLQDAIKQGYTQVR